MKISIFLFHLFGLQKIEISKTCNFRVRHCLVRAATSPCVAALTRCCCSHHQVVLQPSPGDVAAIIRWCCSPHQVVLQPSPNCVAALTKSVFFCSNIYRRCPALSLIKKYELRKKKKKNYNFFFFFFFFFFF